MAMPSAVVRVTSENPMMSEMLPRVFRRSAWSDDGSDLKTCLNDERMVLTGVEVAMDSRISRKYQSKVTSTCMIAAYTASP
jgi:hypothetical protein